MPDQGSSPNKTFTRTTGVYTGATAWGQTEAAGRGIRSDDEDVHDQDIASALSNRLMLDGGNKPTAIIDAGGFGFSNLGTLATIAETTVSVSTTTNVLGSASLQVLATGSAATITSLGAGAKIALKRVRFDGANTLTHNGTSLILPGAVNIATAAGDVMWIESDASSNVRVVMYRRADGTVLVNTTVFPAEVTVASASTTDILAAASPLIAISGTVTITSLGTGINRVRYVRFTGALILTHNASSLILPGGVNITTAAGDTMIVESDASSNVRVISYQSADGTFPQLARLGQAFGMLNGTLVPSVSGNALTVALKTLAGADPSTTDPVWVFFRDATAATGDYVVRKITAATSIVVASTKTLGTSSSSVPFRIWVVAVDTGSGVELGVVNCLSGVSVMALRDDALYSPTATPAGSAQVIYTTSGQTTKPVRLIGYLEWGGGLATAGTWASGPTKTQLFGPGVSKPGDVVQTARTDTGAVATGSTNIPLDDTIPQSTEGDQYMSQAAVFVSPANLYRARAQGHFASSSGPHPAMALFRDSGTDALAAAMQEIATGNMELLTLNYTGRVGATTSSTFKVRGGSGAGTTSFNGEAGSRLLGGVLNSFLEVQEIMA